MSDKRIFKIGKYIVELIVPDTNKDLSNNINVYGENRQLLWNISKLFKNYCDSNGLKYYDEIYFDIRLLEDEKIFCIGFTNHCEIDLKSGSITKIINNR